MRRVPNSPQQGGCGAPETTQKRSYSRRAVRPMGSELSHSRSVCRPSQLGWALHVEKFGLYKLF